MTAVFTPPAGKEVLGHPRGLWYLVFAEAWERFSYYGMQALLVLYLTQYLLIPENVEHVAGFSALRHFLESLYGPLATPLTLAAAITGLYSAGVYFTPMIGGYIDQGVAGASGQQPAELCVVVAGVVVPEQQDR